MLDLLIFLLLHMMHHFSRISKSDILKKKIEDGARKASCKACQKANSFPKDSETGHLKNIMIKPPNQSQHTEIITYSDTLVTFRYNSILGRDYLASYIFQAEQSLVWSKTLC